eukprot:Skav231461  [mRNA]  locus=scaffold1847:975795:976691:- [translate_table: standard]
MQKPAASARLRAFGEALRQVNAPLLEELALACPEGSQLRRLLLHGRAFGDAAVQIHWGSAVEEDNVLWHIDAPNSALHMAVPQRQPQW